jgi:catechol 2,3-dioxygenase-like lactoylglutathione lyase family enzyme
MTTTAITLSGIHHIALTVTDVPRARDFYTRILGFNVLAELGPKTLLVNGSTVIAINGAYDPSQVPPNDRFTENRAGLDHVSFAVNSRADLERAVEIFDQNNVSHGEIKDLGAAGLPIYVLAFRDPDNIQLELTAPHG